MKYICIALLTILISCNHRVKPGLGEKPLEQTPQALQETPESDIGLISKRSYDYDIMDQLYQELCEKDPDIKAIETMRKEITEMENDSVKAFNQYDVKSKSYYSSAIEP